jgi:hypothetical protein
MDIEVKILLDHYYHLVNNSNNFITMKPWQCYEKAQDIKEEIRVLKEDYKDNEETYKLLTEFCEEEYNPLGVKWNEKT